MGRKLNVALAAATAGLCLIGRASAEPAAAEIELVKFICNSTGGVAEVIAQADDLIVLLSPLPHGCAWLSPGSRGEIGATIFYVDGPGDRMTRVSRVLVNGTSGYSAGLVELLS